MDFTPDYRYLEQAARNIEPARLPLYDHTVSDEMVSRVMGVDITPFFTADPADLGTYFKHYCGFFFKMGYDAVSFEGCIGDALPFSGALSRHTEPAITDRESYERYPWDTVEQRYFELFAPRFEALRRQMPEGMRAVGGVGNGAFECVQEVVGYTDLCYLRYDDEDLFAELFNRMGELAERIWKRFLREYGDIYCVCRFGDDLGFRTATLLAVEDIKGHILPQYKKVVDSVHAAGKPFLLHSCGQIFDVMDDLIDSVGIDAKHSNEDAIAPFSAWVQRYGSRIGNFGGIDTDVLCRSTPEEIALRVEQVVAETRGYGGFALGSGNSIPPYVPLEGYLAMNRTARRLRGETPDY